MVDIVLTGKPVPSEVASLIMVYADHETSSKMQEAFIANNDTPEKVKEILAKAFRANRYWLGRAAPPEAANISYTFIAQHLATPGTEPKSVNVSFDPYELEAMRARRVHMDRVLYLETLSDVLFTLPQIREATVFAETEKDVTIRFTVPPRTAVRVGIGNFNWGYQQAVLRNAGQARVRFDRERGVPLSEEILSRKGVRLAYLEYENYEPFRDGGLVPLKITADFPLVKIGTNPKSIFCEMNFQIIDGKFWTLLDATTMDMSDAENPELLAVASLEDVRVVAAEPEAPKDPPNETDKKDADKEAGQEKGAEGSKAASKDARKKDADKEDGATKSAEDSKAASEDAQKEDAPSGYLGMTLGVVGTVIVAVSLLYIVRMSRP